MKVISKVISAAKRGKNQTIVWGIHKVKGVGEMMLAMNAEGLCWVGINCTEKRMARDWAGANFVRDDKVVAKTAKELAASWPGDFEKVSIPIALYGTEFQIKVWKELLKIKSGNVVHYEDIAKKIGKPKAVRAVGSAVGKNPVTLLVPCHRVVNKSGTRINYGWGAEMKKKLLKAEGAL